MSQLHAALGTKNVKHSSYAKFSSCKLLALLL